MVMPGQFARLKCVAVTGVGAFLDWGLPKDLLVPFREQKVRMDVGKILHRPRPHRRADRPHHRLHPDRPLHGSDAADFRLEQEVI